MNHITHWLFQFVRWTVLLFSIGCLLFSSYMLLAITFNLPTSFKSGKNTTTTIGNYNLGMPLKARLSVSIADTSISTSYNLPGQHSYFAKAPVDNSLFEKDEIVSVYSDTIRVHYVQNAQFDNTLKPLNIVTLQLNEGNVYVSPQNMLDKLLFGLPSILYVLMMGLIGLQLFRLLTVIRNRSFFEKPRYRMVASIGWTLIGYNAIVFLLERMQKSSDYITATVDSTIANYRLPFELTASIKSNVSFQLLIIGFIVLAFAIAFKRGYELQKDKNLTI